VEQEAQIDARLILVSPWVSPCFKSSYFSPDTFGPGHFHLNSVPVAQLGPAVGCEGLETQILRSSSPNIYHLPHLEQRIAALRSTTANAIEAPLDERR